MFWRWFVGTVAVGQVQRTGNQWGHPFILAPDTLVDPAWIYIQLRFFFFSFIKNSKKTNLKHLTTHRAAEWRLFPFADISSRRTILKVRRAIAQDARWMCV